MSEPQSPSGPSGPWEQPTSPDRWAPPPYQSVTPVEQPDSIRLAVRLMWVGAAISAIGIVVAFTQSDELRRQLRKADSSLSTDELDTAVAVGLTFVGIIGVISIALWLWMATTNGQGRSWARTVATVLGGLNVVFSILGIVLAVTILILLYRPDATAYYEYKTRTYA